MFLSSFGRETDDRLYRIRCLKPPLYLASQTLSSDYHFNFYRPQRSWGKVMFLQASVILLTGGGAIPACLAAGLQGWSAPGGGVVPGPGGGLLWGVSRPTPKGEIEGDQVQAHTQGENWGGSGPGPHPRRKLSGIRSRPIPKGEIEGGSGPGPHPKGKLRGIRSRPTPKGEIEGDQIQAHTQGGNWGGSSLGPYTRGGIEGDQVQAHTHGGYWGGSDPDPHPRGKLSGIRSTPPTAGTHPTGMHSFYLCIFFYSCESFFRSSSNSAFILLTSSGLHRTSIAVIDSALACWIVYGWAFRSPIKNFDF